MSSVQDFVRQAVNYLQRGNIAEARRCIDGAREQNLKSRDLDRVDGILACMTGEYSKAAVLLREYVKLQPSDVGGWVYLANAEMGVQRYTEAVFAFGKASQLQPTFADIRLGQGKALLAKGDVTRAIGAFRKAIELQPDLVSAHMALGQALLNANRLPTPSDATALAQRNDPSTMAYSVAYVLTGHFDIAIQIAEAGIAVASTNAVLSKWREELISGPYFPQHQGIHSPQRQIYMSACVGMLESRDRHIAILEIGTYMGASMITWANAIHRLATGRGEIVCVDAWEDVDLTQYENDKEIGSTIREGNAYRVFRNAVKFVSPGIKIDERRGFSDKVLPTLSDRTFDIIYIDGCHLHPEVLQDIQTCDSLLADGGFMCGDDLELQLHEVDAKIVEANARRDYIANPLNGAGYHPGVTLGVGIFFGPVSVFDGFWVMQKTAGGYRQVQMRGTGILPYHWPKGLQDQAKIAVLEAGHLTNIV